MARDPGDQRDPRLRTAVASSDDRPQVDCDIESRELLWACGLCHDVGKPFELSPRKQKRWKKDVGASSDPVVRHSVYGVHVALRGGLPEAVAHTAGCHSGEGKLIKRSLENMLVHYADHAYWNVLERAGFLKK
jgi:hypothetical protein